MKLKLKCPICGEPLSDLGACKCGFCLNPVVVPDSAPKWFKDSVQVLKDIAQDKDEFVFANTQLFQPGFDGSSVLKVIGKGSCLADEVGPIDSLPEFIAYSGVPAFLYQEMLCDYVDSDVYLSMQPHTSIAKLIREQMDFNQMFLRHVVSLSDTDRIERLKTYEAVSTLSAYTAPTWIDTALCLTDQSTLSFTEKSASQLLYSYMVCDKSMALAEFPVKPTLKAYVENRCAFIGKRNFQDLTPESLRIAPTFYWGVPELYVNNGSQFDAKDYNMFLFTQGRCVRDLAIPEEAEDVMTKDALFFLSMWRAYGEDQSTARKVLDSYEGSQRDKYIAFWKDIKARLHK